MYVRDAKNRDEAWLLDQLEELSLPDPAFRSRDYVVAVDETTGDKAGFGRIHVHRDADPAVCEVRNVGVLADWRSQGVGAHVLERLVETARDAGFDRLYALTEQPEYFTQFGFTPVPTEELPPVLQDTLETVRDDQKDAIAVAIAVDTFEMPDRLRERFKSAGPDSTESDPTEDAEDFGIDAENATYKYDL
ncbi:MAG: GNAT family N-acetyltransferase [Salinarchaeum sp.]